jgi:hypothetical protein
MNCFWRNVKNLVSESEFTELQDFQNRDLLFNLPGTVSILLIL